MKNNVSKQSRLMGDRSVRPKGCNDSTQAKSFPTDPSRFFTSNQAASVLGISVSGLQYFRETGRLQVRWRKGPGGRGINYLYTFSQLRWLAVSLALRQKFGERGSNDALAKKLIGNLAPFSVVCLKPRPDEPTPSQVARHKNAPVYTDNYRAFAVSRVCLALHAKQAVAIARQHPGPVHLIHVAEILQDLASRIAVAA